MGRTQGSAPRAGQGARAAPGAPATRRAVHSQAPVRRSERLSQVGKKASQHTPVRGSTARARATGSKTNQVRPTPGRPNEAAVPVSPLAPTTSVSNEAHEAQQPFSFAFSPQPAPLSPGSQRVVESALSRGLSVSSVRLPLCEGQNLPSSKAVTSAEGVVVREHVATYAQAHGRALDVWQEEWAARKLAAARARRASCPALPLPSLCRSLAAPVSVPGQPALPLEHVPLPEPVCPESACMVLPEALEVDTFFLDHILDFLRSEDEAPTPLAVSDSSRSSGESSDGEDTPATDTRGRNASCQNRGKHSAPRSRPGPRATTADAQPAQPPPGPRTVRGVTPQGIPYVQILYPQPLEPGPTPPPPLAPPSQRSPRRRPPARKLTQAKQASAPPRARYPHSASELLLVPPAFAAAERHPAPAAPATPAAPAASRRSSLVAVQPRAAPDAGSSGSSSGSRSGRIRSGTHRKRVAKQREAKA